MHIIFSPKLFKYFNGQKIIGKICFLSLLSGLIYLSPSIFLLLIYDKIISHQNINSLIAITCIYLIVMFLGYLIDNLRLNLSSVSGKKFIQNVNQYLLSIYPDQQSLNPIKINRLDKFLQSNYIFFQFDIFFGFIYLIFLYFFDPYLSLYCFISGLILFYFTRLKSKGTLNTEFDNSKYFHSINFFHSIGGKNLIEKYIRSPITLKTMDNHFRQHTYQNNVKYLKWILISGSLVVSSLLVIFQDLNPGIMFMVMVLMSRILQPAELFASGYDLISKQNETLNELYKSKFVSAELNIPTDKNEIKNLKKNNIEINNLQLLYDPRQNFLVSKFELIHGKNYLVVGPNGSGKSTFLNSITGSILTKNGLIKLGDIPVLNLNSKVRKNTFNLMPQGGILSQITLREFLSHSSEYKIEYYEAIFEKLGLLSKVFSFKHLWDTPLDQVFLKCSPGEIQKFKLIQSTLTIKPWNFFDEPEQFLDSKGSTYLKRHFKELKKTNSSIIMISHNPTMMEFFDYIIIIDKFQIQPPITKEDFFNKIKIIKKNDN